MVASLVVVLAMVLAPSALAQDFTVTKNGNTGPGTLRDAIAAANANPGPDRIVFAPAASQLTAGQLLIQPTALLPTVTDTLTIDGSGLLDGTGRPRVRIDGGRLAGASSGLVFNVPGVTLNAVTSLAFTGWNATSAPALKLQGSAPVVVTRSVFGLDGVIAGAANATGIEMGTGVAPGPGSTIGGAAALDGNVISGNRIGVKVNGGGAGVLEGNLIGTNASGTGALPNTEAGIRIENAFATVSRNTISGNAAGIMVVGGGGRADIMGNRIGRTADGTGALGNTGPGISIAGADNVLIGGTATSAGNTIAGNAKGVTVISGKGQTIRGNAVFSNSVLDVDLADDGPTGNDAGDRDPGANNRQNFPAITSALPAGGQNLAIAGSLDAETGTYDLDFYAGPSCGAASRGLAGGSTAIGTIAVTVSSGATPFTTMLTVPAPTRSGVVVATATSRADGSTSELSGCTTFEGLGPTVVNVATDNDDGACTSANCSLREAINRVNGFPSGGEILFAIGSGGAQRIQLGSALPSLTKPAGINGLSQTADSTTPQIEIDGSGIATAGTRSLTLGAGSVGSLLEGLAFTGARGPALDVLADAVVVRKIWLGLRPDGTTVVGNESGIRVAGSGATIADTRIAGSAGPGIDLDGATGTTIRSSAIGVTAGNGIGVLVRASASGATIQENEIANSVDRGGPDRNGTGVAFSAPDVVLTRNAIHDNQRLGIDLLADGRVTATATGAPAYVIGLPVLKAVDQSSSGITVRGTVPVAGATIEVFSSPACDSSGSGEGAVYRGTGQAQGIDFTIALGEGVPAGAVITATATDPGSGPAGTSEFSRCAAIEPLVDASVDLTAPETVPAGAARVPLISVPPSAILASAGAAIESAPLADTPLSDTPLTAADIFGAPLAGTPLAGTPLAGTGLTDNADLLRTVPLSTLPLLRDGGWPALLEGTSLEGRPLQEITLGDVFDLSLPELDGLGSDDIVLSDLDFANSPLGSLTPITVALGALTLGSIDIVLALDTTQKTDAAAFAGTTVEALTAGEAWCWLLRGAPIGCAAGSSLGTATVMSTALRGAPLAGTPLAGTPLAGTPLAGTPLAGTPLAGTPLADTRIGQTPLAGTPLAGTPLAGTPLPGTPLAAPLAGTPLAGTPLAGTPLAGTGLSEAPLAGTATRVSPLAGTPLAGTPLAGTLLAAPLAGTPLAGTPLAGTLLAGSPLAGTSVGQVSGLSTLFTCGTGSELACPTSGTIESNGLVPRATATLGAFVAALGTTAANGLTADDLLLSLTASALTDITVGEMLSGLFNPSQLQGTTIWEIALNIPDFTIGQLIASVPGFSALTIGDLLEFLTLLYPNGSPFTVADVLSLLLSPQATGWETLDIDAARLQSLDGVDGGVAAYVARIRLTPTGGAPVGTMATATVRMSLPSEFGYVAGTSAVAGASTDDPDVLDAVDGTPTLLEWRLSLPVGSDVNLTFSARAGITLGPATGSIVVTPANGTAAPDDATVVVVGDTFEENGTVGGAAQLTNDPFGSLFLSYIREPGDHDYFQVAVPAGVPQGTRIAFRLSHLPADYDLVVYGPGQELVRPVEGTPTLDGLPLGDVAPRLSHTTDVLGPQVLDDITIDPTLPVLGVSALRGTETDVVNIISDGAGETYTVQVDGFNGASSDRPYMLRVTATRPPDQPACAPRTFAHAAGSAPTAIASSTAGDVNTLFVVNRQQLRRTYGAAADAALQTLEDSLPAYRSAGFPSAILSVDGSAAVRTAYDEWNACPTSALRANAIVTAIGGILADYRNGTGSFAGAHPQVQNVVLIGGDAIVPFARLSDLTTVANESGYTNDTFAQSELQAGARAWKMLSDNPYGDTDPVPYFGRQLHVPDLAVGRLVETPPEIAAQITAFVAADGRSAAGSTLTTGYDFLTDGAKRVKSVLDDIGNDVSPGDALVENSWNRLAALQALGLDPDIVSLNGHADFYALQPASGNALLTVGDVVGGVSLNSATLFSMGCHAGLSITDAFTPGGSLNPDWAQGLAGAGAAGFVGNTGYGFGDTDRIAYGEELNGLFVENIVRGGMTLGQALAYAKQQYVSNLGLVGAYDEKSLEELTLFGLPMWRLGTTGLTSAAAQPGPDTFRTLAVTSGSGGSVVTDVRTGLQAEPFDVTPTFERKDTARGSYYLGGSASQSDAERLQVTHFRPIQPKEVRDITIPNAHGALITELETGLYGPGDDAFHPVYARPVVDASSIEPTWAFNDVAFPSRIQSVTTTKRLGQADPEQKLVLVTGLFTGRPEVDAGGTGVETVVSRVKGLVYSSSSGNYVPAEFTRIVGTQVSGRASFAVDLRERGGGAVERVLIAYKESGAVAWRFLDLAATNAAATRWSGSGELATSQCPANASSPCFQFFAQAVNANGNVAISTNKGVFYEQLVLAPVPNLEIVATPTGAVEVNGWFKGTTVTVGVQIDGHPATTADGIQVSVDGGGYQLYTAPFDLSGDGLHLVVAKAPDGRTASLVVPIDGTAPVLTATAATADGSPYVPGTWTNQDVVVTFTCDDGAGSGVVGPTSSLKTVTTAAGTELSTSVSPDSTCADLVGYTATAAPFGPVQIDRVAPSATLSTTAPATTRISPIPVVVTFTEPVAGFAAADLLVVNGTVSNLAGDGTTFTFDLVPSGQGTVSARVVASAVVDRAGNANQSSTLLDVVFDSVAPLVTLVAPASPAPDTTPTLAGTCGSQTGDAATVTVRVYAGTTASGTALQTLTPPCAAGAYTVDASVLGDGTYTAVANQDDSAGNTGTGIARTFTVDTEAPSLTLTSPAGVTSDATPALTGTCSAGEGTVTISVYAGSAATGTAVQTVSASCTGGAFSVDVATALADGAYTAVARQTDAAGNTGASAPRTFTVDTGAPAVTLTGPAAIVATATPSLAGTCSTSDLATVTIAVYAGTVAAGTPVQTATAPCASGLFTVAATTLADGTYTAVASQADAAGNTGTSAPRTFVVDTVAPAPALTTPPATTSNVRPPYSGTCGIASGDLAPVSVRVYAGSTVPAGATPLQTLPDVSCASGAFTATPTVALADGTYTATASQADAAGNVGTSAPRTFVVNSFNLAGKVVFSRGGALYSLTVGSGALPALLFSPGGTTDFQPAVSPDGKYVVFSRGGSLWVYAGGGAPQQVKNGTSAVVGTAPTWAPTGTSTAWRIAYEAAGKGVDVFVATLNPTTGALTGPSNITNVAGDDRTPAWSPATSGSLQDMIVFSANRSKGSYKLYMRKATDTAGTTEVRVTIGSNDDLEPAWSPDASQIAFSSNFAGGTGGFEIHLTTPVPDANKTRITTINGTDGQPLWLNAGTILFVSQLGSGGGGAGLYTMAPSPGAAVSKVANTGAGDTNPG